MNKRQQKKALTKKFAITKAGLIVGQGLIISNKMDYHHFDIGTIVIIKHIDDIDAYCLRVGDNSFSQYVPHSEIFIK